MKNTISNVLLFILVNLMITLCLAQDNKAGRPVANNDSFYNHTAASVLTNDKDPNGDKLYINWFYINGIKYTMTTTSDVWSIPKIGKISFKPTGEIKCDTTVFISSYQVSDRKGGLATAWCKYYPKPAPVPVPIPVIRPPVAVGDIFIVSASKMQWFAGNGDTILNLLSNDSIAVSDSFRIIYWMKGGCYYDITNKRWSAYDCDAIKKDGISYNLGCTSVNSEGLLHWDSNYNKGKNSYYYVLEDMYYVARDRKGRTICANVLIIINP